MLRLLLTRPLGQLAFPREVRPGHGVSIRETLDLRNDSLGKRFGLPGIHMLQCFPVGFNSPITVHNTEATSLILSEKRVKFPVHDAF